MHPLFLLLHLPLGSLGPTLLSSHQGKHQLLSSEQLQSVFKIKTDTHQTPFERTGRASRHLLGQLWTCILSVKVHLPPTIVRRPSKSGQL